MGSRGRRGMSMVEVMIAISVLAFVLLAFLSVIQSSASLSASSRETSVAAFQLHAAVESTFAMPFTEFVANFDPKQPTDANDPDHAGDPNLWLGHLGSRPVTDAADTAAKLPDYCQQTKILGQNFSWKPKPVEAWVRADDLPLMNQHMWVTWVKQDAVGEIDWVEYRLTISWTNFKGKTQTDSVTTRRSR